MRLDFSGRTTYARQILAGLQRGNGTLEEVLEFMTRQMDIPYAKFSAKVTTGNEELDKLRVWLNARDNVDMRITQGLSKLPGTDLEAIAEIFPRFIDSNGGGLKFKSPGNVEFLSGKVSVSFYEDSNCDETVMTYRELYNEDAVYAAVLLLGNGDTTKMHRIGKMLGIIHPAVEVRMLEGRMQRPYKINKGFEWRAGKPTPTESYQVA